MAETKFTPGPWYVAGIDLVMADDLSKQESSLAVEISCDASEQEANAHLIAAAPELYNFVMHVKKCMDKNGEYAPLISKDIDEVLAKARGENHA